MLSGRVWCPRQSRRRRAPCPSHEAPLVSVALFLPGMPPRPARLGPELRTLLRPVLQCHLAGVACLRAQLRVRGGQRLGFLRRHVVQPLRAVRQRRVLDAQVHAAPAAVAGDVAKGLCVRDAPARHPHALGHARAAGGARPAPWVHRSPVAHPCRHNTSKHPLSAACSPGSVQPGKTLRRSPTPGWPAGRGGPVPKRFLGPRPSCLETWLGHKPVSGTCEWLPSGRNRIKTSHQIQGLLCAKARVPELNRALLRKCE